MKQLEKLIREELLQAADDVCLSIYIPSGTSRKRCDDLKELTVQATEFLKKVYSASEVESFIKPLARLSVAHLDRFQGAIGFFRSMHTLQIIDIPIEIEKEFFVSNHFNIKPLLKWLQEDIEYFCVDFSKSNVEVFRGDAHSFTSLGCYGLGPSDIQEIDSCVVEGSDEGKEGLVFLSGNTELARKYLQATSLAHVDKSVIDRSAYHGDYERLWQALKDRVRHGAILKVKRSLLDYNVAVMNGMARSEIEEIIQAAKAGAIKKLIIAQDEKIWGRFDAYKNNLNRVNRQINYEDDDLLDAISEKVMEDGGEVVLASKKELPKGKAMLAILKDAA